MERLNYMASRIRAALLQMGGSEYGESSLWWWTGLQKELTSRLSFRALSQSIYNHDGPEMNICSEYFNEIGRIDSKDPTRIFKEYYGDWWNFENEWKTHSVEVDHIEAYVWHIKKYGPGRENKNDAPFNGPAPPANTMVSDCKSQVCKDRLGCVLGEVQKANQIVRSFFVEIEEQRISATRHILHLKALNKYKIDNNLSALSQDDVEKLFEEGIVLEKPDHVDMDDNIPTSSSINRSESFVV